MASAPTRKSSRHSSGHGRSSSSLPKTQIVINVYDLLPPGKLSSLLWTLGSSLLHTGVVIKDREYAYGGHDQQGLSGVYWTKPRLEPPGGTFRCELLQGFTFRSSKEIDAIIKDVSQQFQGPSYNLLSNNCNHFTSFLCKQLTGQPAPSWLNRAATIGVALPCVVPREWIAPPDHDTADGELLDEDEEDERASMLRNDQRRSHALQTNNMVEEDEDLNDSHDQRSGSTGKGKQAIRDTEGRGLPASERAPKASGR
ncbi:hypothetical protein MMC20_003365 [Loxospora ochrophaea]|nr:hypothetical protein [Loxospora ochrophaea]